MNENDRQQIIEKVIAISELIEQSKDSDDTQLSGINYYKDFDFKDTGLAETNIYVAIITNNKDNANIYEVYSGNTNNLIATVDEQGILHFMPEYIEALRQANPRLIDEMLSIKDKKFELPQDLAKEDVILTKGEIDENSRGKKLEKLEKTTGIEGLSSYSEMDANQEIRDEQEESKDSEKDKKQKAFEKITNKQELNPNTRVTQTETLGDMIPEVKEKGFTKIGVVYSDKVQNGSGRFSLVGIDKEGNIEKLDGLQNIEGTTTGQKVLSINSRDGSLVEQEQVAGMIEINGRSKGNGQREYLSFKISQYGIIEVDYVRREMSKEKGEAFISAPIETSSIKPTTREVRDFMDRSYNVDMDDEISRAQGIIDVQKGNGQPEKMRMENIDDNPYNDSHDNENTRETSELKSELNPDDTITLENGNVTTLREQAEKNHTSVEGYTELYNEMAIKNPRTNCRAKFRRCRSRTRRTI